MRNSVTCTTLLNLAANPLPARPAQAIHMHPDTHRFSHEVRFRNSLNEAAVLAVIAIITHDKKMSGRNTKGTVFPVIGFVRDQDIVSPVTQLLDKPRLERGRVSVYFQVNFLAVDSQPMPLINDLVAGQANNALDVVNTRIGRQTENNNITALGRTGFKDLEFRQDQ